MRAAFSEDPNTEYGVASPPHSQSTVVSSSSIRGGLEGHDCQKSQSPMPLEPFFANVHQDDPRREGPPFPPRTRRDDEGPLGKYRGDHESQPSGLAMGAGVHSDRTRIIVTEPGSYRSSSPPLGSRGPRPIRIRRPSKLPEPSTSTPEDTGPVIHEQSQGPRLSRSSSLLDRLSNPPALLEPPVPPLRDRVGLPEVHDTRKKSGPSSPLGLRLSLGSEGLPSLRDRVEPTNDTQQSTDVWNHRFEDGGGGSDWRGRQGRRDKPRKRGKGQ
jgi:hypothetical protein